MVPGAECVGAVLDHGDAVLRRDLHDRPHVGGHAAVMDKVEGAGPIIDQAREHLRRDVESDGVDVAEADTHGAPEQGCYVRLIRLGRREDLVTRLQVKQIGSELQSDRAVSEIA